MGRTGSVTVFDLKTNAVLGVIAAQPDADGIIYDPGTDLILVSAGDSNSLITFKPNIDPKSGHIETPIPLGGAPEFLAADGSGKVFVNLEDKDTVAVVDLKAQKGDRPLARLTRRRPGGHGNRPSASHLVYRMPQTAEDDRDGYGERKSAGRSAYRSRSGCNQGQRFRSLRQLRRRYTGGCKKVFRRQI